MDIEDNRCMSEDSGASRAERTEDDVPYMRNAIPDYENCGITPILGDLLDADASRPSRIPRLDRRNFRALSERAEYVRPLKRRPQRFVGNMSINFSRGNAGMAEQPLDKPNIHSCFN